MLGRNIGPKRQVPQVRLRQAPRITGINWRDRKDVVGFTGRILGSEKGQEASGSEEHKKNSTRNDEQ